MDTTIMVVCILLTSVATFVYGSKTKEEFAFSNILISLIFGVIFGGIIGAIVNLLLGY